MKLLAILRHAEAEPGDPHSSDHDRDLTERGRRDAEFIGRELRDRGLSFDLALASSAKRAVQTQAFAQKASGTALPVSPDRRLYEADADGLLAIIREIDAGAANVLLVGHNPAVQRLILALARDDERGLRNRVATRLPAGGLAVVRLPIDRWADAEVQSGEITELILPQELD